MAVKVILGIPIWCHPDRPAGEKDLVVWAGSGPLLWGWVVAVA